MWLSVKSKRVRFGIQCEAESSQSSVRSKPVMYRLNKGLKGVRANLSSARHVPDPRFLDIDNFVKCGILHRDCESVKYFCTQDSHE